MRLIIATAALLLLTAAPAAAADIEVDDPVWNVLTEAERDEVESELKQLGVLAADDRIVRKIVKDNEVTEQDKLLDPLVSKGRAYVKRHFARKTVDKKQHIARNACGQLADAAANEACISERDSQFAAARKKFDD